MHVLRPCCKYGECCCPALFVRATAPPCSLTSIECMPCMGASSVQGDKEEIESNGNMMRQNERNEEKN